MNQHFKAILTITSLVFCNGLMAENIDEYTAPGNSIEQSVRSEHNSATINCDAVAGNDNGMCVELAQSRKNAADAKLSEESPSNEARYNVSIAKGTAEYDLALKKCETKTVGSMESCKKVASDTWQHNQSEANARLKMMRAIEQNDTRVIDNHPKEYKKDN